MDLMPRISHVAVTEIRGKLVKLLPYMTVIRARGKQMMNKSSLEKAKTALLVHHLSKASTGQECLCCTISTRTRKDTAFVAAGRQWEGRVFPQAFVSEN